MDIVAFSQGIALTLFPWGVLALYGVIKRAIDGV